MKLKHLIIITVLSFALALLPGCNQLENLTNSGSKLLLWSLVGLDTGGAEISPLLSDVQTSGDIFNDNAQVTLSAVLLDPLKQDADTTFYQDVIVDQIDISFTRADGLNVEGKDVPYSFSQKVHLQLDTGLSASSTLSFILIQHNAKLESPLIDLVSLGQEHILKLEAKVSVHARDVAGNRLEPAIGYLSIWCSNFADPGSGSGGSSGGEGGGGG